MLDSNFNGNTTSWSYKTQCNNAYLEDIDTESLNGIVDNEIPLLKNMVSEKSEKYLGFIKLIERYESTLKDLIPLMINGSRVIQETEAELEEKQKGLVKTSREIFQELLHLLLNYNRENYTP